MLDGSAEIDRLKRIVALLLALAGLAERAAAVSHPVRRVVLCILRRAEAVAWQFVSGAVLVLRLCRHSVAPPSGLPAISPTGGEIGGFAASPTFRRLAKAGLTADLPPRGGDGRQARGGREGARTPTVMPGPVSPAGCATGTPVALDVRDDLDDALGLAVRFRALALVLAYLLAGLRDFSHTCLVSRAETPRPAASAPFAAGAPRAHARDPPPGADARLQCYEVLSSSMRFQGESGLGEAV